MNVIPIVEKQLSEDKLEWMKQQYHVAFPDKGYWNILIGKYSESHRAYHNLSHIYSMLQALEQTTFQGSDNLLMAIWYHDIIYNSKKKDNEKLSADLFKEHWSKHLASDVISSVETIILSTEKHYPLSEDEDIKIMLDLDLFILSSPSGTYMKYAEAVRHEYKWVPKILYKNGRKKVLQSFLKRDRIYFSDYFSETLEPIARENLSLEIKNL